MTYVLDLKRLWSDRLAITESQRKAAASVHLDPRQKMVSVIVAIQSDDLQVMKTLQSAITQLMVRELIIVNGSHSSLMEDALTQFAYQYPRAILVDGHNVCGLAEAYNLGAQYASTPFALFLSAYGLLQKNAIMQLLAIGIRKPGAWVVGAALTKREQKHHLPSQFMKNFKTLTTNEVPEVSLVGGGLYAQVVSAECLLLPMRTFAQLKGFDKRCYHTTFHWDLCLRVHQMGGDVFQAPEAVLAIANPALRSRRLFKQEWQSFLGWSHFYQKNFSELTNIFSRSFFYLALTLSSTISFGNRLINLLTKRETTPKRKMA
ncbi:glycosyltransferase [Candidatus Berkiella aquae]|uniref:N-glycosyltransferase n=1 Tax=Candidatus Berkiella aquae TaxID=295108 RepID=A0A0Q9YIE0_9GAMM|nr:hypothetical protein [Candidatus Berkiella aquae]MCS5712285.1 hypothetical protein [Candidatus Berkiella aquae]